MDIRMLPIRNVFERFPRLVRDIARQQGKQIDLIVEGEDTRVDKAIIDEIGEPLVHMIRNSVDHGLESPAERRGERQVTGGDDPALRRPGVEPGRDHDRRRRTGDRRRRGAPQGDRARPPARGRGRLRPRGRPVHLRGGLLHRGGRDRPLRPRRGPRRGPEVHGAPERPHRGRDDAGGGDEVHDPAPPDPRHHLRAHGGSGRPDLRAALRVRGGEPAVRSGGHPEDARAGHPPPARPPGPPREPGPALRPARGRRRARPTWWWWGAARSGWASSWIA